MEGKEVKGGRMVDTAVFPGWDSFTPPYRAKRKGPTDSHYVHSSFDGALLVWPEFHELPQFSLTTSLRIHLPPNGIVVGSIIIHVGLRFN